MMQHFQFFIFASYCIFLAAGSNISHTWQSDLGERAEEISGYLINLDVHKFMKEITGSFQLMCKRLWGADKWAYHTLFNSVIGFAEHNVTTAFPYSTNLWVNTETTNIILEFQSNGTAEEAFKLIDRYRKNFINEGKDVLCVGINYRYEGIDEKPIEDRLVCNWIASSYYDNGTLKEHIPMQEVILLCP